ncbi:Calcineurin-like phosphoesterase [Allopseudospirillum japonicum]|uniref:Calcineurin-like phosphoesterase n=1 Tax=Allopseudospirillum japonicum TaxID=64971 RepID=A0A1H6S1P4_9GAMM|nr:DNA repair exonuclease [Allopseudospirillum japonicum]SEI61861.1 Calcineurin-like phosphoesterase [Allopseudospirillum japonicum]
MPKFLHTADWQIGRQFTTFEPEEAAVLAQARLQAVQALAEYAQQQKCQGVWVAGDIFDSHTVPERTLRRLFNTLEAFSGPWYLLPGNHDAALNASVWTRAQALNLIPDHVHLLLEPKVYLQETSGVALLAAPLTQRHTYQDLTAWFDQASTPKDFYRVGIAHGSVAGVLSEQMQASNLIAADRAQSAHLDYFALGDWHGYLQINAKTWYAGTPESDRFRNNHSGYCLEVELTNLGEDPQIRPYPIGQYQWQQSQFDLPQELAALTHYLNQLTRDQVCQIQLTGTLGWQEKNQLESLIAQARAQCHACRVNIAEIDVTPTTEDLQALQADAYLQDILKELQQLQKHPQQAPMARTALTILAQGLTEINKA